MATFIAFPILGILTMLQSSIVSRMPLLHGTADLILLVLIAWALQEPVKTAWQWSLIGGFMIGFASILPLSIPILSYLSITTVVLFVKRKIWENQIIAMFALTFIGTILSQATFALAITIQGTSLPIIDTLRFIILPSLLLNILLATPIYVLIKDLADWIFPEVIKV